MASDWPRIFDPYLPQVSSFDILYLAKLKPEGVMSLPRCSGKITHLGLVQDMSSGTDAALLSINA